MKKAIITGGAGFIGSHLVELLLNKGFFVVAIDDMSNGQLDNVEIFKNNPNYDFKRINLSQPFDDLLFENTDYVFHLAALADIVPSIEEPLKYHQANVTATIRVLEACRKHKVKKFVYSASSSCYGIPEVYPTPESAKINCEYPYAFTKYVAEEYVLFWGKLYDMPVISLRYFNAFGTRARTNGTYGAVFKVFLSQKLHEKPLTIVGDGEQTRDFTYVSDIARANLMAAESDLNGEIINIGTGKTYSVNYLANLIGGPTVTIPKRPGEPDSTHAEISRAKELLGWEPQVSFEEGVKIMLDNIDYWKDAPLWDEKSIEEATKSWFKYLGKEKDGNKMENNTEVSYSNTNNTNNTPINENNNEERILVTGGAGYVGSVLVPSLLQKGHKVTVLDTFWFWKSVEEYLKELNLENHPNLAVVKGDLRNKEDIKKSLEGVKTVIHLACISNDPSSELNAEYTHSVNYDGSINLIDLSKEVGVKRFIYASSSSVYGIKDEPNVSEDLELEPLTQYSKLKVEIEHYLLYKIDEAFKGVIVRPSTVCGYSPRQRLDVVVNILTNFAYNKGKIKVFGGNQLRPNIHIKDMVRVYELLLEAPIEKINKKTYNAGYENLKVLEIANLVKSVIGDVAVDIEPSDDPRSYHVCSQKIADELGFETKFTVMDAIADLKEAFAAGKLQNLDEDHYFNVKTMKRVIENG